jgi:hypothetical protein
VKLIAVSFLDVRDGWLEELTAGWPTIRDFVVGAKPADFR